MIRGLLAWYRVHGRRLPWRPTGEAEVDPYAIWVAEVMLQQTQVETVLGYYDEWMRRFPSIGSLAAARLEDVLSVWRGLGYYQRARNLHRAARRVVEQHGGRLPSDPGALRDLPGIGDYTGGAIAAIAFGLPEPAVDGNVQRLLSRRIALEEPVDRAAGRRAVRAEARRLMSVGPPEEVVQALIELGALVCAPRHPDCPSCPWRGSCRARAMGRPEDFPRKATSRRSPRPVNADIAVLALKGSPRRWVVGRRRADGLLGGLWEHPTWIDGPNDNTQAVSNWRDSDLVATIRDAPIATVSHAFTHRRVTGRIFLGEAARLPTEPWGHYTEWRGVTLDELERLPASVLTQKVAAEVRRVIPPGL